MSDSGIVSDDCIDHWQSVENICHAVDDSLYDILNNFEFYKCFKLKQWKNHSHLMACMDRMGHKSMVNNMEQRSCLGLTLPTQMAYRLPANN